MFFSKKTKQNKTKTNKKKERKKRKKSHFFLEMLVFFRGVILPLERKEKNTLKK